MRIRHKILLGYLALIASAVVAVAFFLSNLGSITGRYSDLMRHDQRILLLVSSLNSLVQRQVQATNAFQGGPDISLLYEYRDAVQNQKQTLSEIEPLITQDADRAEISNITAAINKYTVLADQVVSFPQPPAYSTATAYPTGNSAGTTGSATDTAGASPTSSEIATAQATTQPIAVPPVAQTDNTSSDMTRRMELDTARLNLTNELNTFIATKTKQVDDSQDNLQVQVSDVSAQLLILSLLLGLGALIGALLLTESFTAPLRRLMRNIQGISSGDLHTAVAVRSRDEIGEVAGVLETMRQRLAHSAAENTDLLNNARDEAEKLARAQQALENANEDLQGALKTETEARQRIEQVDRLRSEFASMISHELKTPVSYVYNYAGALKEHNNSLNDGQRTEFLTAIQGEAQHLLTLIDDIMAISLLESIGLNHRFVETDLRKLTDSVVKDQQLTTRRHNLSIKGPDTLPVRADPTRLKQVMNNLISNAIKYSPQGGQIEVRLRANLDNTATVYVRDYGIGIAPEDMPKLFDRFTRIQRKETMAIPGSGLGLYIAHHIIEAHGGTLKLEPAPGKGTIAEVTVPMIDTSERPEEEEGVIEKQNGRVHRVSNKRTTYNGNGLDGKDSSDGNIQAPSLEPVAVALEPAQLEKELVR